MPANNWIILGDKKSTPTPRSEPVTVVQRENISKESSSPVLVDAATIETAFDLTTVTPVLSGHQNVSGQDVDATTFVGFEGGKKVHHLGNSTGTISKIK